MHTSRLWRDVVTELGSSVYQDVPLDHALVDSFAMTIVNAPESIDVVLTENTFGDILSDVAAAVTGGLGLAASASIGDDGPGLFEPVTALHPRSPEKASPTRRRCSAPQLSSFDTGSAAPRRPPHSSGRSTLRCATRRHRTSAARQRRVTWAMSSCAGLTVRLPSDGHAARDRLHVLPVRAFRLRLYELVGASLLRPAPAS